MLTIIAVTVVLFCLMFLGISVSLMAAQLDLPLPEITVEDFKRAWTHFELVTDDKDWNEKK